MVRQPRYLLNRNGRYFARLVIPKALRSYLQNRTELREALGPDRRAALTRLHTAVAGMQATIADAEHKAKADRGEAWTGPRYDLSLQQIAFRRYSEQLSFDSEIRNSDPTYAAIEPDDSLIPLYRNAVAGRLSNAELRNIVGEPMERYRMLGLNMPAYGDDEWRSVAQALCVAELEFLGRFMERHEGDFSGTPEHPLLRDVGPEPDKQVPVPLRVLFDRYMSELKANGKGEGAERRWRPVFEDLISFTRTADANKLTKKMLVDWKDAKIKTLAPRTVRDVYLTAVNAVLNWAVSNDLLRANPARDIKLKVAAKPQTRPKGFTREEAVEILQTALRYHPPASETPQTREHAGTSAAKRWAPLLCAHTGSRISEITQLRKEDVRQQGGINYIRITPDAGRVKNRHYRDVPLHREVIEEGFLDFVEKAPPGPLFYPAKSGPRKADPAQTVSGRVSNWLKKQQVVPEGVSPNHGWRHAFKTTGLELGIDGRVLDAIQGHAARTAGEKYGDVTLLAKQIAIEKMPHFRIR